MITPFTPDYHSPFGKVYQSGESAYIYWYEKINVLGVNILPCVKVYRLAKGYSVSLDGQRKTEFVETEEQMLEVANKELQRLVKILES